MTIRTRNKATAARKAGDKNELASRVRAALAHRNDVSEVRMFGGIGFLLNGNLMAGASVRGMLLRVGEIQAGKALARPGARPLIMRGSALKDYVYIDPAPSDDRTVKAWLKLAVGFVETLPPKVRQARARRGQGRAKPRLARKG